MYQERLTEEHCPVMMTTDDQPIQSIPKLIRRSISISPCKSRLRTTTDKLGHFVCRIPGRNFACPFILILHPVSNRLVELLNSMILIFLLLNTCTRWYQYSYSMFIHLMYRISATHRPPFLTDHLRAIAFLRIK